MCILITLDGPRATGKTTLARELASNNPFMLNASDLDVFLFDNSINGTEDWIVSGPVQRDLLLKLREIAESGRYYNSEVKEFVPAPRYIIVDSCSMMSAKEERKNNVNSDLLTTTAKSLLQELDSQPESKHIRSLAYQHYDKVKGRELQVHVMVVADPDEFLEPFVTEVTN